MDINRKLNLNRYRLLNLSCRNKAKSRRTQMPPLINNLSKCGNVRAIKSVFVGFPSTNNNLQQR
eukprot:GAFH01001945.1.p8 GENE.GAFH01001945.1~~GAFH01001945.1.p8  ORF type:complete len:64 (-),score=5.12 GAFH01001945.1:1076-1267(-)